MDKQMYERMEILPILQDFDPYWGRCPASPHENQGESIAGQGNRCPFDAFGLRFEGDMAFGSLPVFPLDCKCDILWTHDKSCLALSLRLSYRSDVGESDIL